MTDMTKVMCDICKNNKEDEENIHNATYKVFGNKVEQLIGTDIVYCCEKCYIALHLNLRLQYNNIKKDDFDHIWTNIGWNIKDELILNLKDNINSFFDNFSFTNSYFT